MKRALVTGAAGFLGRALSARLRAGGWDVRATTLRARDGASALDVRDRLAVLDAVRNVDAVFNLAGHRGMTMDLLGEIAAVNTMGAANVVAASASCAEPRPAIVLVGSAEEYGHTSEFPMREDAPMRPISAYGASKFAATTLARAAAHAVPVVVVRPAVIYGPGQPAHQLVASAVRAAIANDVCRINGGTQTRDLVYVDDVADALIRAAERAETLRGEVLNIGTGEERSVRAVAEQVIEIAGSGRIEVGPPSTRPGDVQRIVFDTRRARERLGWVATTDLDAGIRRTLAAAAR